MMVMMHSGVLSYSRGYLLFCDAIPSLWGCKRLFMMKASEQLHVGIENTKQKTAELTPSRCLGSHCSESRSKNEPPTGGRRRRSGEKILVTVTPS